MSRVVSSLPDLPPRNTVRCKYTPSARSVSVTRMPDRSAAGRTPSNVAGGARTLSSVGGVGVAAGVTTISTWEGAPPVMTVWTLVDVNRSRSPERIVARRAYRCDGSIRLGSYASRNAIGTCRPTRTTSASAITVARPSARDTSSSRTCTTASGGSAMRWRYTTVPVTSAGIACALPVIVIAAASRMIHDDAVACLLAHESDSPSTCAPRGVWVWRLTGVNTSSPRQA
jgi:hypothetical protein